MSLGCHEPATADATLSGMPPRDVFERLSLWAILRRSSKWNEFASAVTPLFHRGLTQTSWGPVPIGLSDEARKLHLARLRLFFLVFLRDECTIGERIVADVFRRWWNPPSHLWLKDVVALQRQRSWKRIVEAIERKPFERIQVPDVDHMALPSVSFLSGRASALERLMWLGLDPEHRSLDPNPRVRTGPQPEMARDRRARRIAERLAARRSLEQNATSVSDTSIGPTSRIRPRRRPKPPRLRLV